MSAGPCNWDLNLVMASAPGVRVTITNNALCQVVCGPAQELDRALEGALAREALLSIQDR